MSKIWVISPYGTKTEIFNDKTYHVEDKGFDAVWKYDLQNDTIVLGGGFIGDVSHKTEEEMVREFLACTIRKYTLRQARSKARENWRFYNEIKESDIVLVQIMNMGLHWFR